MNIFFNSSFNVRILIAEPYRAGMYRFLSKSSTVEPVFQKLPEPLNPTCTNCNYLSLFFVNESPFVTSTSSMLAMGRLKTQSNILARFS